MAGWKTSGISVGAILSSLLTFGCCLPLPFLGAAGSPGLPSSWLAHDLGCWVFQSSWLGRVFFKSIVGYAAGLVKAKPQLHFLVSPPSF